MLRRSSRCSFTCGTRSLLGTDCSSGTARSFNQKHVYSKNECSCHSHGNISKLSSFSDHIFGGKGSVRQLPCRKQLCNGFAQNYFELPTEAKLDKLIHLFSIQFSILLHALLYHLFIQFIIISTGCRNQQKSVIGKK